MVLEKLDMYMWKIEARSLLLSCTKINSKWIKDLNGGPGTSEILDRDIRKTLQDTDIRNKHLNRTPEPSSGKKEHELTNGN
jgi:hypothetical protein